MKIIQAKVTDFDALTYIVDQANEYSLVKSGEPLWGLREYALRELASHLEAGECFVMKDGRKIIAAMTITDEDPLWGEAGSDGQALYVHKLMKDPGTRVNDIGATFLLFAAQKAFAQKRTLLRCDTISAQKRLLDYYTRLGFKIKRSFVYKPSERGGVFLEVNIDELHKQIAKLNIVRDE